tara:strand:+ start:177 stop:302 length:126 start_codon:yes stop_codon:yes gene_type:complete
MLYIFSYYSLLREKINLEFYNIFYLKKLKKITKYYLNKKAL